MSGAQPSTRRRCACALLLAALSAAGCLPSSPRAPRLALTASALDALEVGLETLSAGRWPAWSMQIEGGGLAFEIETSRLADPDAGGRDCSELGSLVERSAGKVPWRADITHAGRVVRRCNVPPRDDRLG